MRSSFFFFFLKLLVLLLVVQSCLVFRAEISVASCFWWLPEIKTLFSMLFCGVFRNCTSDMGLQRTEHCLGRLVLERKQELSFWHVDEPLPLFTCQMVPMSIPARYIMYHFYIMHTGILYTDTYIYIYIYIHIMHNHKCIYIYIYIYILYMI